jgi:hypothetical protein
MENWMCEYFGGLLDCFLDPQPVAVADVDTDGNFYVELPDFAGDPVINKFSNRGAFWFLIRDRKTENIVYRLRPKPDHGVSDQIAVAPSYTTPQEFGLEAWK